MTVSRNDFIRELNNYQDKTHIEYKIKKLFLELNESLLSEKIYPECEFIDYIKNISNLFILEKYDDVYLYFKKINNQYVCQNFDISLNDIKKICYGYDLPECIIKTSGYKIKPRWFLNECISNHYIDLSDINYVLSKNLEQNYSLQTL